MVPYMFVIDGVPLPENHNYNTIGGAKIHVWVMEHDIHSAEKLAIAFVDKQLWTAKKIAHASEMLPEQLAELDTVEESLYRKALSDGISATFFAYPKTNGKPDDPIVIGHP